MTNFIQLLMVSAVWAVALWATVAAGRWLFHRASWRRRAEARAFDALVERHRRQA
jgi:hypothetical protein